MPGLGAGVWVVVLTVKLEGEPVLEWFPRDMVGWSVCCVGFELLDRTPWGRLGYCCRDMKDWSG